METNNNDNNNNDNDNIRHSTYEMCCIFNKQEGNDGDEESLLSEDINNLSDNNDRKSSNDNTNNDNDKYSKLVDSKGIESIRLHKYYYGKIDEAQREAKYLSDMKYKQLLRNTQNYDFDINNSNANNRKVITLNFRNAKTIHPSNNGVHNFIHENVLNGIQNS
jgi:hypothetical protein